MSNVYGIDVSAWQGTIDWAKVKKAGCGHAVLKINMKNLSKCLKKYILIIKLLVQMKVINIIFLSNFSLFLFK